MEIDDLAHRAVYRSMGAGLAAHSRIGIGCMDKTGWRVDHQGYDAPTFSLVWLLRGSGVYQDQQGRRWSLAPGSCFVRIPGRRHGNVIDPASRWKELFIDLGRGLGLELLAMQALRSDPPVWMLGVDHQRVERLAALIAQLADAADTGLPGCCVRLVEEAVAMCAARAPDVSDTAGEVERARRFLTDDLTGRGDLRRWCRDQDLDYDALRKAFTRATGHPPHRYRIRHRLDRACGLLQGGHSVAATAELLGYPSAFAFSSQFKAHLGLPPSRYRGAAADPPGGMEGGQDRSTSATTASSSPTQTKQPLPQQRSRVRSSTPSRIASMRGRKRAE